MLLAPAASVKAYSGPIFTVMNTSQTLPDGVWFRNSPHTADTDRVTGHGVYMNEQVQLRCYSWGDAVGTYDNRLWYNVVNVTRPTNAGVENSGYLNAHYIDGGLLANQINSGVPDCSAPSPPSPSPPPPPSPHVTLAQGPTAPLGYRYAVTLTGFSPGAVVSVSCRDTLSPGGFRNFTVVTSGSGYAFTGSYCYSADGPDHWVVVNNQLESNHVTWAATRGSGTSQPLRLSTKRCRLPCGIRETLPRSADAFAVWLFLRRSSRGT